MTKEQLLNHYRNLYQTVKREKDEIERELIEYKRTLEEYQILSTVQYETINSLNKRIEILKRNQEVLESNLNEFTKHCDFGEKNSMSSTVKVVIK